MAKEEGNEKYVQIIFQIENPQESRNISQLSINVTEEERVFTAATVFQVIGEPRNLANGMKIIRVKEIYF